MQQLPTGFAFAPIFTVSKRDLRTFVIATLVAFAPIVAQAMGNEEFVGPFASWANVQTQFGAAGNGVTDDTAAVQNALNSLSFSNPTIYFPAGTYLITGTLTLNGPLYINIIGQDPAVTTLLWGGAAGGTMFYINGMAYSRVDRLTFNGQGSAGIAIDQSWTGSGGNFDTGNEYADDVFENVGMGFQCGALGQGCAETKMLRDQFLNDSTGGISMGNFNALDMFVWYSRFVNDGFGVTNTFGAGNFHVYDSIFEGSLTADLGIGNTGGFNFRDNYSIGSNQFLGPSMGTSNPANITIEGNTILDTTQVQSIAVGNLGPVLLIDNTIRSLASATVGPAVEVANWNPSDLFSMGNTFTVSSPTYANGHSHSVQDQVVAPSKINPVMPTLPGTPPNNNRQIFEVASGSTAAQIQQAINQAAAASGDMPVVHLQPGFYNITTTLTVPPGSDMQIIGDGYQSRLGWSGNTTGPVIQVQGPSKATLRDFSVTGNGTYSVTGIEVDKADQAGSSIFMEQSNLSSSLTNLFVDGLDYANVQLHDFGHGGDSTTGKTSVVVTGGPSAAAGTWKGGMTNIFAGASAGSYNSYAVSSGAHVGIRDIWYDNGAGGSQIATVTGPSALTYAGSMLELPTSETLPEISFNNFTGTAALLNLGVSGNVSITGKDTNADILGIGLIGPSKAFFSNTSSPKATTEFLNGQTTAIGSASGTATVELTEQGTPNAAFLTTTLSQVRTEQPSLLARLPAGVTDVRFYRVFVDTSLNGIQLDNLAPPPPPTPPVNGVCGSANSTAVSSAPTANLCKTGKASKVSSSRTSYTWSCTGSSGGSTATCSAPVRTGRTSKR